jgi:hypothetical protein
MANEALALTWLRDFRASEAFARLHASAQSELEVSVRVLARCFTRRWSSATETPYSLSEITADDVSDILVEQIPRKVSATDPDALIDATVAFLVWAAAASRLRDRGVEYACRKIHRRARAAMAEERTWAPGKAMVMRAMRDGIDPTDTDRLREHAIGTGLDAGFVDEFLPPPPVSLGNGRYLIID